MIPRETSVRRAANYIRPKELSIGRIPPSAIDLEESVVGQIMIDKNALPKVVEFLRPDDFYDDRYKTIYEAAITLFRNSTPPDARNITHELRKTDQLERIGGAVFIGGITMSTASAANIEYHGRVVREMSIKRTLIEIAASVSEKAYDYGTDVFELLNSAEQLLFELSQHNAKKDFLNGVELGRMAVNELQRRGMLSTGITGVPSGFSQLDKLTNGWQPGNLIVLGARPGMGKSAFVVSAAEYVVTNTNMPVALFSLEMNAMENMMRFIAVNTEIQSESLKLGNLNDVDWRRITNSKVFSPRLFIDDTAGMNVYELRAKARRLVENHGVRLIIVDYLQLLTVDTPGSNRENQIAEISRTLKAIAKECNVPMIALSPLSRGVETRGGDKRPQLSDLRESGSIESDADVVMFLYRPEYYKISVDEEGLSTRGMAEIIVAKHRNGSTDTVKVKFNGAFTKFLDWDSEQFRNHNVDTEGSF